MTAALLVLLLFGGPKFDDLKKAYESARADSNWKAARAALLGMSELGNSRAAPYLRSELDLANEDAHRHALFRALAFTRFSGKKEFLQEHLGSEDPYYRATALEAIAPLDGAAALSRAGDLLQVDDDRRVRRVAAEVLVGLQSADAVRVLVESGADLAPDEQGAVIALLRGLKTGLLKGAVPSATHRDPDVRVLALLALSTRADFKDVLEQAKSDKDRRVKLVAATGLARHAGAKRTSALAGILKKAKKFDDKWELYDLIARGGVRDKALTDALATAAKSGSKALRAKAAESLGAAGGAAAIPLLRSLLAAKKPWQLPIGAARGLAATRAPEAMPVLIEAIGKTTGRLQQEVAKALASLTGQPFGRNAALWERWWRERGTGFRIPDAPPALWEEETAAGDGYAFYGIELNSNSVSFVCDVSGSMQGDRIKTLQRELAIAIKRFPPKGKFNLVFFNDKVTGSGKLVAATAKTKQKALDQVGGLAANGATNIWDALETGLKDKNVDTVVLLTDGAPTAAKDPKMRHINEIMKRFLKENRARMVMLHVVSIGQKSAHLRAMARLSGGNYVER